MTVSVPATLWQNVSGFVPARRIPYGRVAVRICLVGARTPSTGGDSGGDGVDYVWRVDQSPAAGECGVGFAADGCVANPVGGVVLESGFGA